LPDTVSEFTSLAFSPDNHSLAFAAWDGVIRIFNVAP
jgi:WD40 repeat protein